MKKIYLNLILLFFVLISSISIKAEVSSWGTENFGDFQYKYPNKILSSLSSNKTPSNELCSEVDSQIQKLEGLAQKCLQTKREHWCKLLKTNIKILETWNSTNNDIQSLYFDNHDLSSKWTVKIDQNEKSFPEGIKGLELLGNEKNAKEADIKISYLQGSLVDKFDSIVQLNEKFKIQIKKGYLLALSIPLACDIKNNRIKVESKILKDIQYSNVLPNDQLDIFWKSYEKIKNNREKYDEDKESILTQAALVGFSIAESLKDHKLEKDKLSFLAKKMFNDFIGYKSDENLFELKKYSSKEDFQVNLYPNVKYDGIVEISWSNL